MQAGIYIPSCYFVLPQGENALHTLFILLTVLPGAIQRWLVLSGNADKQYCVLHII